MTVSIALMFLVEAATTCAPAERHRLRAGATVVPAIVSVEPRTFDPAVAKPAAADEARDTEETGSDAQEPQASEPAEQCKTLPEPVA